MVGGALLALGVWTTAGVVSSALQLLLEPLRQSGAGIRAIHEGFVEVDGPAGFLDIAFGTPEEPPGPHEDQPVHQARHTSLLWVLIVRSCRRPCRASSSSLMAASSGAST